MSGVEDRDHGMAAILEELRQLNNAQVVVGIQGEADSHTAYVASLHEFGSEEWTVTPRQAYFMAKHLMGIDADADKARFWGTVRTLTGKKMRVPERSFMRATIDAKRAVIDEATARVLDAVASGKLTARRALGQFGHFVEALIRAGVLEVKDPPNAPLTIARKGSEQPLIDTGRMRSSIRYVIK